ncbi:PRD domain-containing protein [Caldibacillus debilis]|nr:PRD domain-containing protein [Caldibacillus debilis]
MLNNNAVIVTDGHQEKVAIGSGIGFQKKKNDIVNPNQIEKIFVMHENEKFQQLLSRIPEEHFTISEEIISYAERQLGVKLNEHIHLVLTDHLSFAIERVKNGIHIKNKLFQEIKILYRREFEIGLWAVRHMKEKYGIEMPEDEAAFLALYIHTMKPQGGDLHETIRQTAILQDMVQTVKDFLRIPLEGDDISYHRLVTHLRFVLFRIKGYEVHTLDEEMLAMIKKKFPLSYQCAREVARKVSEVYGIHLPDQELGYITLHIERLRTAQP